MNDMRTSYLVIGFSVAGLWGVRAIREKDQSAPIVAVSEEQGFYSRPLITYLLGGKTRSIDHHRLSFGDPSLALFENDRVERLDAENRLAFLRSGKRIHFEKALIATGGVPIMPPLEGVGQEGVFTFTGRRGLEQMRAFLLKGKPERVLILGGGFIGLKTCEAFMHLGLRITLVELSSRLLPVMLDEDGSRYLEDGLSRAGVQVLLGETVTALEGRGGRVFRAVLRGGEHLPVDCVVVAVGVRPNVEWLRDSGIEVRRGVVVDAFQETSREGLFAAGDVAETR
ncbi:MAG: NAD(P)/FAD-dependent oxidoreductase, partial [Candidatus Caldatribacteriaceae bacterium]